MRQAMRRRPRSTPIPRERSLAGKTVIITLTVIGVLIAIAVVIFLVSAPFAYAEGERHSKVHVY